MRLLLLSLSLIVAAAGAALVWRASESLSLPADAITPATPNLPEPAPTPPPSTMTTPSPDVKDRVAFARGRHGDSIKRHCEEAGLKYPPRQLFMRAFKHEGEIEAWGSDDEQPMKLIKTWPLTARSGILGPKRREGDRQIPEGCYRVIIFNPQSNFHLSMGLDYPNAADRVHSDKVKPGGDIYIHGNNVSIGCLAVGDDMIEELYLLAADFRGSRKKEPINVHIFPARMQGAEWDELRTKHPEHANLWGELEPIYSAFEESRRIPAVKVTEEGTYAMEG